MLNFVLGQKDREEIDVIQRIAAKTIKVLTWWEILTSPFTIVSHNDKEQTKMGRNDHLHKFEGQQRQQGID